MRRAPGGDFRYANTNFPIIAAAMEGATGEHDPYADYDTGGSSPRITHGFG